MIQLIIRFINTSHYNRPSLNACSILAVDGYSRSSKIIAIYCMRKLNVNDNP